MNVITGLTRGGEEYTPEFVMEIKQSNCIGCGRCFKVCPRDVFELIDREDADIKEADDYEDEYGDDYEDGYGDDDEFSDDTSMVMSIQNGMDCIGCGSCARICPKKCFTHAPQGVEA
uniref:Ferredoxin III n=1 Tax=Candidatus Kentrum sp. FW TaxID=2126338 RepID=A0A450THX1_9GAMM|nr:MAG: ferredoxin III, nif-specific [Candidatus Kentron sp. FW]